MRKFNWTIRKIQNNLNLSNSEFFSISRLTSIWCKLFSKKSQKIIPLKPATIKLDIDQKNENNAIEKKLNEQKQIVPSFNKILMTKNIPWENMNFDELCSLNSLQIDSLRISLKIDKFNISDNYFKLHHDDKSVVLNFYYQNLLHLLMNNHSVYQISEQNKKGYLKQMYVMDLQHDKELMQQLQKFITHINRPNKLQGFVQPTFAKKLLTIKRQLLLQGVQFPNQELISQITSNPKIRRAINYKYDNKSSKDKIQDTKQKDSYKPSIKLIKPLNYQYEFWIDVHSNRSRNSNSDYFTIKQSTITNPNQTLILSDSPKIKVKYIIRKKKKKDYTMKFVIKANLQIQIDKKYIRNIKIQWDGPGTQKNFKHQEPKQQSLEECNDKMGYYIIDYQNIMRGNPTVQPIFNF